MGDVQCGRSGGGGDDRDPARAEERRLAALAAYDILDTPPEQAFQRIVDIATALFDTPISLVSFIDRRRQWSKARIGLDISEVARELAFCDHVVEHGGTLVVPDASADIRFAGNPYVAGAPFIRFYAGAALTTPDGYRLGTVCVISPEPRRDLSATERQQLEALAAIAITELELRRQLRCVRTVADERDLLRREVEQRVETGLRLITTVFEARARRIEDRSLRRALFEAADRIAGLESLHRQIREGGAVFDHDGRAYLLALLDGLQDAGIDDDGGRRIELVLTDIDDISPDRLTRLGIVMLELAILALLHGRGTVSIAVVRQGETLELTVTDRIPGRPVTAGIAVAAREGLRLISELVEPQGLQIDRERPHEITVRLAA